MNELDLTLWPYHPHGSWQRALLHQSLGLPVDDADTQALARWDWHPVTLTAGDYKSGVVSKTALLRQQLRVTGAVIDAATAVLDTSEVVGSHELARRVAGMPGVPPIDRTVGVLKACRPSNHTVNTLKGGTTRRRMYKRYIDTHSGRPGHFFTRRVGNFDRFIAESKVHRRDIGIRMRDNLQRGRPWKEESVNL